MNKVEIIGRLTKDPEVRYTASTQMAVANFTVAVDDGFGEKKRTNFIPVVVFGKTAESCEKFTAKGLRIAVEGKIQTGSYEDKEGRKVYTTDVVADRVQFLEWGDRPQAAQNAPLQAEAPDGFEAIDEDVPF